MASPQSTTTHRSRFRVALSQSRCDSVFEYTAAVRPDETPSPGTKDHSLVFVDSIEKPTKNLDLIPEAEERSIILLGSTSVDMAAPCGGLSQVSEQLQQQATEHRPPAVETTPSTVYSARSVSRSAGAGAVRTVSAARAPSSGAGDLDRSVLLVGSPSRVLAFDDNTAADGQSPQKDSSDGKSKSTPTKRGRDGHHHHRGDAKKKPTSYLPNSMGEARWAEEMRSFFAFIDQRDVVVGEKDDLPPVL